MKMLKSLLLVVCFIFTSQVFAGAALTKTPVNEDGDVFWTIDLSGNDLYDFVKIEVNFLPTFDPTTFIQNAIIRGYDHDSGSLLTCSIQEYISRTNTNYGINYQASDALTKRTKGSAKFSDGLKVTVDGSNCTEIENGEEGDAPSVHAGVFTGIRTLTFPDPYPSQSIATYTHEAHFSKEPGTSKGSLSLSDDGYTRILTLTYETGASFTCLVSVGSPMDDFVLASKPHVVLKGGKYSVRKNTSGYTAGRCISISQVLDSRNLP